MKIYFDGDSWTRGNEIDEEHRLSKRFSGLISKELGAEEYNISRGGASNNRIVRQMLFDNDISEYDLAIIQMVYPERSEFYSDKVKDWKTITIADTSLVTWYRWEKRKKWLDKNGIDYEFWTQYYKNIYSETYGCTNEKMCATTIRNHCKVNNVKLILMSQNYHSKIKFDLQLQVPKYPQTKRGHPTMEGHKLIAEDILRLI